MTAVRLTTADEVASWRSALLDGMHAAQDRMKSALGAVLKANGLRWSSPVTKAPAALWDQDAWAAAVDAELVPVAGDVADEILGKLRARTASTPWRGLTDPTDMLVGIVTGRALDGGPAIGDRLANASALVAAGERFGGVLHPDRTFSIIDEYQVRFEELNKLASNVASAMSNAAVQLLAETATATEPSVQYVWNCSFSNSRRSHMDAHGQTVPAGSPFDVDAESLMYPGDPGGSNENTCNCQCFLEVEGVDLSKDFEASLALEA